jgi:hypothetical protein
MVPYRATPDVNQEFSEKCSWFGNFGSWIDPDDNGENASGLPETTPGIAFYCQDTLRHLWRVTLPNNFNVVVRQVDIGPDPATGRGVDVNTALAVRAGYDKKTFPTDATIKFVYLGPLSE